MYNIGDKVVLVNPDGPLKESVGKEFTVTVPLIGFVEVSDGANRMVVSESCIKKAE